MTENEAKVLEAIRQGAMTVRNVVAATGFSRMTVSKHLAVLEAKNKIESRDVGNAKIYLPAKLAA